MAAEGVVLFLQNAGIFHNALDIAEIVRQVLEEGWTIEPKDLTRIWPRTPTELGQVKFGVGAAVRAESRESPPGPRIGRGSPADCVCT
ncbi:hypothetical protein Srut_56850 [Streptomyces rutgersensis]|nr:hypothetical protein SMCF_1962 [Streptomyces coelicoflavus ZG0656]KPC72801.1 hypothetical protein ADL35_30590 [Streptomyces sp. NRRL WC-3753]GFH69171.1 hypothetical protein Srut_56850 [Streptomyces rutgersensis]